MIGLKIMLKHGHFLSMILEIAEASRVIKLYRENPSSFGSKLGNHNVKCPAGSPDWCVAVEEVVGLHTFDPASIESQAGQMPAQGYRPWAGRSGL